MVYGGTHGAGGDGSCSAADRVDHVHDIALALTREQNGAVAVLVDRVLQLVGDDLGCFVPADAHPLVYTAQLLFTASMRLPVLTFHGVLQAIGAKGVLLLRAAARACAQLRCCHGILGRVIGLLPDNNPVDNVNPVQAHAAAVVVATSRNPFALDCWIEFRISHCTFSLRLDFFQLVFGLAAHHRQPGNGCGTRADERTPRNGVFCRTMISHERSTPLISRPSTSPRIAYCTGEAHEPQYSQEDSPVQLNHP